LAHAARLAGWPVVGTPGPEDDPDVELADLDLSEEPDTTSRRGFLTSIVAAAPVALLAPSASGQCGCMATEPTFTIREQGTGRILKTRYRECDARAFMRSYCSFPPGVTLEAVPELPDVAWLDAPTIVQPPIDRNEPDESEAEEHPLQSIADRMIDVSDGLLDMQGLDHPYTNDPEGPGHIVWGWLADEAEEQYITIDDRLPEALELQLLRQVRRIAKLYQDLGDTIEARAGAVA
jgi:hypothetical protein